MCPPRKHGRRPALMGQVTVQSSRIISDGELVTSKRLHDERKVRRLDFSGKGIQTSDLPYNLCMMQYMRYGARHVNIQRVEVKTTTCFIE